MNVSKLNIKIFILKLLKEQTGIFDDGKHFQDEQKSGRWSKSRDSRWKVKTSIGCPQTKSAKGGLK